MGKLKSSDLIGICAAVVAAAALFFGISEAKKSQTHRELSTRPILRLQVEFPGHGGALLHLSNFGLGPALIDEATITLDGTSYGLDDLDEIVKYILRAGMGRAVPKGSSEPPQKKVLPRYRLRTFETVGERKVLKAGATITIFDVSLPRFEQEGKETLVLNELFSSSRVEVNYHDLYEKKYQEIDEELMRPQPSDSK